MSKIKITCDSTCDLTPDLYKKYDVEVVPLGVVLGDILHHDSVDIAAEQVFDYVKDSGVLPKTSAVSIDEYSRFFSKYTAQGYSVVHINLSSDLSICNQNANLAAQELDGVYVIDSRNLSSGSGLLVIAAAELAAEGLSAEEIVERITALTEKVDASFVLQTLDYLRKGGRCSGIVALGANALRLRPEIEVVGGKMQVGKKYRGKLDKSVADYVRGRLEGRTDIDTKRIFITHSGVPDETVEMVRDVIKFHHNFSEILVSNAGCTISSHCGPSCLGVLFIRK